MNFLLQNIPEKWRQPLRFCIVGGIAATLHYGIYLLLQLWMWPWLAYTIGYALSFIVNYILTNYFTFRTRPSKQNGLGFIFSHAVNYGLHIGLLELFLWMGVPNEWAPIPVLMIAIPINFLLLRFFFIKHISHEN